MLGSRATDEDGDALDVWVEPGRDVTQALSKSTGSGKMMVEFFSAEI